MVDETRPVDDPVENPPPQQEPEAPEEKKSPFNIKEKLRSLRGSRLYQWIVSKFGGKGGVSYSDLERSTMGFTPPTTKRQHAKGPIQIVKMNLVAAPQSGDLIVKTEAKSDSGNTYSPTIQFDKVEFHDEDLPDNVTFKGADGNDYHITPVELRKVNVKVFCNCLDFYWRFSAFNARVKSLLGNPAPPYKRKTTTRPPANEKKTPGVCKHILKLGDELVRNRIVR